MEYNNNITLHSFEMQLLINLIKEATSIFEPEFKKNFEDDDVNKAFGIFGSIKKYEIAKGEEKYARLDLEKLFGIDSKKMTKNQMYNLHCSKLVNTITILLRGGELKFVK